MPTLRKTDEQRQNDNLKSFQDWLKKSGKSILPIPNTGVLYAGFPPAELAKMRKGLQSEDETKRIYEIIAKAEKDSREYTGRVSLDTLHNVLKRLKSPLPKLVEATGANAGHEKRFSDMLSCAEALASADWALLPRRDRDRVWHLLSEKYAENLQGDIQIWEGVSKRAKLLEPYKVMIETELKTARKNGKLSAKSLKTVEDMIKKYEAYYGKIFDEAASNDKRLKADFKKIR
ncbi:MAG: hypothetical protein KDK26_04280 [Roseivivax sp.]|nr:hypothetical protein [Roseivivax sp.]